MANEETEKQEQAASPEEAPKKKGLPLQLIIIIAAVLVVGSLLAFGGFYMYNSMKSDDTDETKTAAATDDKAKKVEGEGTKNTQFHNLDTFYVNLADKGEIRYLKISISLEFPELADIEIVKKKNPIATKSLPSLLLPIFTHLYISSIVPI